MSEPEFYKGEAASMIVMHCTYLYWRDHWPPEKEGYMFWGGTGCGEGWMPLIQALSVELELIITRHIQDKGIDVTDYQKPGGDPPWPYVVQIKEKFGGLRFYVSTAGIRLDMMTPQGVKSFKQGAKEEDPWQEVYELIGKAEKKCSELCENCGKPGKLRDDRPWILTLCDNCPKVVNSVNSAI